MTSTGPKRAVLSAMYVGLALTIVAALAPYVDRAGGHLLADHIRDGYPTYSPERIDSAVDTWLVLLSVVGAVGIVCWLVAIWGVRARKGWARGAATAMSGIGSCVYLAALLTKDSSGEVGLAPALGWIGMLPTIAGVAAVAMLWTSSRPGPRHSPDAVSGRVGRQ